FAHCPRRALSRAACTAGSSIATSTPMIAITTSSSTSVKPCRLRSIALSPLNLRKAARDSAQRQKPNDAWSGRHYAQAQRSTSCEDSAARARNHAGLIQARGGARECVVRAKEEKGCETFVSVSSTLSWQSPSSVVVG